MRPIPWIFERERLLSLESRNRWRISLGETGATLSNRLFPGLVRLGHQMILRYAPPDVLLLDCQLMFRAGAWSARPLERDR